MKTNRILFALFLTLSLASCKKDESKPEEVKKPDLFIFTLNAVVKSDDDFQIFYKEDNSMETPFQEDSSVWVGVKGSETAQDIVFTLPEDVIPTNIRFDFGQNNKQPEIVVNNFKVSYKGKDFNVSGKDFFKYFLPDENFIKVDVEATKITPLTTGSYDPMMFSTADLGTEMGKLAQ